MTTAVQDWSTPPTEGIWRDPKAFVAPDVWDREIKLLVRDHPFDTVMAERLFGQAIAYLITAMEKHGQQLELGCGELIDAAVHAFILDTRNYREFCHQHFNGRFLEHIPEIERKHDARCSAPPRSSRPTASGWIGRCGRRTSPSAPPVTPAATAIDRTENGPEPARFRPGRQLQWQSPGSLPMITVGRR
jgi:hypothetical protein